MRIRPVHLLAAAAVVGAIALPLVAAPALAADADIRLNEVESSGGVPGDWAELYNAGATPVDVSGWIVKDDDDTRTSALPAGAVIPAGGFFVVEEAVLGFGLGANDAVRVYLADGTTLIDSYSWAGLGHATTTYGRNPDGLGTFATTSAPTKGAANDFSAPVVINEIESQGGVPGDWIELGNTGASTVDVSGFVLRDDGAGTLTLPTGTTIESGGYLAVDTEVQFGLGGADSARLFAADGTTLVDSFSWTEHAATTYGRCPDLTGALTATTEPTKGLRNACAVDVPPTAAAPWPGSPDVTIANAEATFTEDLSGLAFETRPAGDLLWAVENGNGRLYRLILDGTTWIPDAGGWEDGATLRYPDGTGIVDSEGVALTSAGSGAGVYVASERNNDADTVSRPSVLRYDVSDASGDLVATREWDLAADLPGLPANGGLEGIAWIPDADLVASGFIDESTSAPYSPVAYPDHGDGLFFVGVEGDGAVYAYALDDDGTFARVATFASGFDIVAELEYDTASDTLLVICDEVCEGRVTAFQVSAGVFAPAVTYERPAGMANIANEGFALAASCVAGSRAAYWADDADTDGFSIRAGSVTCAASADPAPEISPTGGSAGELAETGADAAAPVVLALGLIGLGVVASVRRRLRASR